VIASAEISRTLRVVGFRRGEAVELAAKPESGMSSRVCTSLEEAARFAQEHGGRDTYFGLNPISPAAKPPRGRARDEDVASVRVLLVDLDPKDASPEARQAARELACDVRAEFLAATGTWPVVVDSGRGVQLHVRHDPLALEDERLVLRPRLLDALAARFDRPLAHVDTACANPSRLARLPGTTNTRTGEVARLLDEGEDVASLADLQALLAKLEASRPPAKALPVRLDLPKGPRDPWPTKYVHAAILGLLAEMSAAVEGNRNKALNRAAFGLGQLAAGGAEIGGALEDLAQVAVAKGLDPREVEGTLRSGYEAGLEDPRTPPVDRRGLPQEETRKVSASADTPALESARTLAKELPGKATEDAGAPFESQAVEALQLLRAQDPAAWIRTRDALKKAKVPVKLLDEATRSAGKTEQLSGTAFELRDPEPAEDEVEGAKLLDAFFAVFKRYLVASKEQLEALVLWNVHTYAIDAFDVTPRLAAVSPQKRCGKTRLLSLLNRSARRPLLASNVSSAALYRSVEKFRPSLLIDEADSFLPENEELRGVLNCGYERDGAVIRCTGDDSEPRRFSAFAPAAIAAIGKLPGTIEDRSVTIQLKRRLPNERVERFRRAHAERELEPLRRQAIRWAIDHLEALRKADPPMPGELDDRAADLWGPLVSIADEAGGEWPKRARSAARSLTGGRDGGGDGSAGTLLLADLRALFADRGTDKLSTSAILESLNANESRPWPEFNRGKPLTASTLARLLKPYGGRPVLIREGEDVARGYKLGDLAEAFERYVPGDSAATPLQASGANGLDQESSRYAENAVTAENLGQSLEAQGLSHRNGSETHPGALFTFDPDEEGRREH
jgi:hypothetical protein